MNPEETHKDDLISRYLLGQLEGDELRDFSLRMMRDKAFRAEVDANRLLMKTLWKAGKTDGTQTVLPKKSLSIQKILIGGILFFGLLIGGFFYFSKSEQPVIPEPKTEEILPELIPEKQAAPPELKPPPIEEIRKETPSKIIQQKEQSIPKPVEPEKPKIEATTIKYAANFELNPLLEEEIEDQIRGNKLPKLTLEVSPENSKISFSNKSTKLAFAGKIQSESVPSIQLSFFNNQISNYQNWSPIWEKKLEVNANAEHEFSFNLNENLPAEPGVYYFIFKDLNAGRFLEIGKIDIR